MVEGLEVKHEIVRAAPIPHNDGSARDDWLEAVETQISELEPDAVIIVGASQRADDSADAIGELIYSNVHLPARLAKRLADTRPDGRLIVFGSFSQLADSSMYRPTNLYAATKQACEDILTHYALCGLRIASLRLFDVFGENDLRPKLLNLLVEAAHSGEKIGISPGQQQIDLIHVLDVTDGVSLVLDELADHDPSQGVRVYGLGSGKPMKVVELVERVAEQVGRPVHVEVGARPYRDREIMNVWTGFRTPKGWMPKRSPYGRTS